MALKLYALSTCIWCRKTEKHLRDLKVEFDVVYVDVLEGSARDQALREVEKYNPARSFPTLVIDGKRAIVGFKPEEIQETVTR